MGKKRKTYSQEFKLMVVKDYLSGKSGGITKIAEKYNIPKDYMITPWTRTYVEHRENILKKIDNFRII